MTSNPTPSQILAALRDFGVDVQTYKGWDTIGRPWRGPDGSPGLSGAVVHHTSTASATGKSGAPSLWWAVNAYELPVCNALVGRGPGDTYLLSGGSAYHCGDGVTPSWLGGQRGYYGQTRLWGIEIDDPGVKTDSLTDYQIENVGKMLAALSDLCGWDVDKAIGTHKCYTDGCHGWQSKANPLVREGGTRGRKNDTIDGPWAEWPGSSRPEPYNAPYWRDEASKHLAQPMMWDGTIPTRRSASRAYYEGLPNKAAWRLACRLYDLGFKNTPAAELGKQSYPKAAVKRARESFGWKAGTGVPSVNLWRRLFGADKP